MNEIKKLYSHFYEVNVAGESYAQFAPIKRDELISKFIRKRYTLDDELATLANANDSDKHAAEYAAYQAYRTSVKSGISEIWASIEAANKEWEDAQPKAEEMRANN